MPNVKHYMVSVTIDEHNHVVFIRAMAEHLAGTLTCETAWDHQDFPIGHEQNVMHIEDGHEITTYDDRDQAIGEAMTFLRDNIDNDGRYM